MKNTIEVEVCYALPEQQKLLKLTILPGSTAKMAVAQSEIQSIFPEIEMENLKLAIFSSIVENDYVLKNGDRVEILRPLLADPKQVRKRRAAEMKAKKEAQKLEKSKTS